MVGGARKTLINIYCKVCRYITVYIDVMFYWWCAPRQMPYINLWNLCMVSRGIIWTIFSDRPAAPALAKTNADAELMEHVNTYLYYGSWTVLIVFARIIAVVFWKYPHLNATPRPSR